MLAWQYLTTADQRIKLAKRVLSLYGNNSRLHLFALTHVDKLLFALELLNLRSKYLILR